MSLDSSNFQPHNRVSKYFENIDSRPQSLSEACLLVIAHKPEPAPTVQELFKQYNIDAIVNKEEEFRYLDLSNLTNEQTRSLHQIISDTLQDAKNKITSLERQEDRYNLYQSLIIDLFDKAEQYPTLRSAYLLKCKYVFSNPKTSEVMEKAADRAFSAISDYQDYWIGHLIDYVSPEFKRSDALHEKCFGNLIYELERSQREVSLSDKVTGYLYTGVVDYIYKYPAKLGQLQDVYVDYLDRLFNDAAMFQDPYVIYHDLCLLSMPEYFENPIFKDKRDQCLKEKFIDGSFQDLNNYLGFYSRDEKNITAYSAESKKFFDSIQDLVEGAVLKAMSECDVKMRNAIETALRVIVPIKFVFSQDFFDAAVEGTEKILQQERPILPPHTFLKLVAGNRAYDRELPMDLRRGVRAVVKKVVCQHNKLIRSLKESFPYRFSASGQIKEMASKVYLLRAITDDMDLLENIFNLNTAGKLPLKQPRKAKEINKYIDREFGRDLSDTFPLLGNLSPVSARLADDRISKYQKDNNSSKAFQEISLVLDAMDVVTDRALQSRKCQYEKWYQETRNDVRSLL